MAISSTVGTRVFIGPVTTSDDPATYTSLTYVEIGEVESIGEFGDEASAITFTSLSDSRVRKLKGARDAGTVAVTVANDPTDAGQEDAIDAEKSKATFAFKVVAADNPDGTEDDGSAFYFGAKIMSARVNPGAANAVITRTFSLGIDTAIHEVPAA